MAAQEIVIGLNGSPGARLALQWAADEARLRDATLRIVHTWDLPAVEAMSASIDLREATESEARDLATGLVQSVLGTTDVPGTLDIVHGPAAQVLVARSHNAALLVIGTQAHTGIRRIVAGSVSHYCLSHATCPVVAVPGPVREHRHIPHTRDHHGAGQPAPTGPLF